MDFLYQKSHFRFLSKTFEYIEMKAFNHPALVLKEMKTFVKQEQIKQYSYAIRDIDRLANLDIYSKTGLKGCGELIILNIKLITN